MSNSREVLAKFFSGEIKRISKPSWEEGRYVAVNDNGAVVNEAGVVENIKNVYGWREYKETEYIYQWLIRRNSVFTTSDFFKTQEDMLCNSDILLHNIVCRIEESKMKKG